MPLRDWFASKRPAASNGQALLGHGLNPAAVNNKLSDDDLGKLWTQCFQCRDNLPSKELEANLHVCPRCGYHFRIGAWQRIAMLFDQFEPHDADLIAADPLCFVDTEPYAKRQQDARKKSRLNEAVVSGVGQLGEAEVSAAMMDFSYLGGSMGSVVGEKITRAAERALARRIPFLVVSSSGGARMQEGIFSLMQMVKTGAALARLHEEGILFISVLTEPTFGGVTASYGMLGDVILAEADARIGFAGRRVIEQTIRQKLPADFQTANYLLQYGQVDMVVSRCDMKARLSSLIRLHTPQRAQQSA
jgi:acetyl-CoA carboxylase carboxyl transferase subunit beta